MINPSQLLKIDNPNKMAKKRILTEYQLDRLIEHKYATTGNSLLDPMMQVFWNWLVEQIPTTWAPNSITLAGLIGNIVTTVFLMLYCPTGVGSAPSWCYLLCALGLFAYQSLDAIDGKQARRTSSSTPLGELFDHGCDAMSMVLIVVGACICTQIGAYPVYFVIISMTGNSIFFLAQWRTYVTAKMHFGILDVTEGQVIVMLLYVHNGLFGEALWRYVLFGVELRSYFWMVGAIIALVFLTNFTYKVFLCPEAKEMNRQKEEGKKTFIPYCIKPIFLLLLFWSSLAACCLSSSEHLMQNHSVLLLMLFGTISTKMSCLLLVAHMTKSEVAGVDAIFLAPLALFLWQLYAPASEVVGLVGVTLLALADLLYYVRRVCCDICDHLNIYCFHITPQMHALTN